MTAATGRSSRLTNRNKTNKTQQKKQATKPSGVSTAAAAGGGRRRGGGGGVERLRLLSDRHFRHVYA
jgi:hypothetical protein